MSVECVFYRFCHGYMVPTAGPDGWEVLLGGDTARWFVITMRRIAVSSRPTLSRFGNKTRAHNGTSQHTNDHVSVLRYDRPTNHFLVWQRGSEIASRYLQLSALSLRCVYLLFLYISVNFNRIKLNLKILHLVNFMPYCCDFWTVSLQLHRYCRQFASLADFVTKGYTEYERPWRSG